MSINWKGVMPAVTTKFTNEDILDLNMFEVNIKAQLEAGVHGIVLGGTLGEASTLALDGQRAVPHALQNAGYNFKFTDLKSALSDLLK